MLLADVVANCTTVAALLYPRGRNSLGVPGGTQRGVVARDRIYGGLPLTKGVFMGGLWACGVLRQ